MDFIHKVFVGDIDDYVHGKFVRFGKGIFKNRALINLMKTSQVKISGSFEYGNDFVDLICKLSRGKNISFKGIVLSKEPISNPILKNGAKKSGVWNYELIGDLPCNEIEKVLKDCYSILVDIQGNGIELKSKKKLPKPGKDKLDNKFYNLKIDLHHWPIIHKEFFSDLPEGIKKAKISHTFIIDSIVMPKSESDPAKIREMAKRKGKIIRKIDLDNDSKESQKEFEA